MTILPRNLMAVLIRLRRFRAPGKNVRRQAAARSGCPLYAKFIRPSTRRLLSADQMTLPPASYAPLQQPLDYGARGSIAGAYIRRFH